MFSNIQIISNKIFRNIKFYSNRMFAITIFDTLITLLTAFYSPDFGVKIYHFFTETANIISMSFYVI